MIAAEQGIIYQVQAEICDMIYPVKSLLWQRGDYQDATVFLQTKFSSRLKRDVRELMGWYGVGTERVKFGMLGLWRWHDGTTMVLGEILIICAMVGDAERYTGGEAA